MTAPSYFADRGPCPDCDGIGSDDRTGDPCPRCGGTGAWAPPPPVRKSGVLREWVAASIALLRAKRSG